VIAGPFTTSASGGYSIVLPDSHLAENLVVECNGGTFTDEATGLPQTAGAMSAYIAGGTASVGTSVHVTPSTTIIHRLITSHNKSADIFEAVFGFTPDFSVAPTDATNPTAGASDARLLAGLRAAAFSQLAMDLGVDQFALITALADDLADGALDGNNDGVPVLIGGVSYPDIQSRFANAFLTFNNGTSNKAGLDNSKLGFLPFAKTVLTDNYKMTYVEGMHKAIDGKTSFKINVTNHNDVAQERLEVSILPLMHMDNDKKHRTSYIPDCNEMAAGEYHCTVYYVMPSVRVMGDMVMSMGYWELAVTAGEDTVKFYPKVTNAMGDTSQVKLKAKDSDGDTVMAMAGGSENRTYTLFKHDLTGTDGNYNLDLFIAAKESMMSFPAISVGDTLNLGSGMHALPITSIGVSASLTGEDGSWEPLVPVEGKVGRWSIGSLPLSDDVQASIYVKLVVNNLPKAINGADYAVFQLTPGGGMMGDMPMDGMDMAM